MALTKITSNMIAAGAIDSTHIGGINTADVSETTNLYFTDARADARIAAANTGNLTEGSNLYFTNARADARIVNAGSVNWNTAYGWGDHGTQSYATQTYVVTQITNLVDSSPTTLDTLNELAAALGDDPNFATTVTNSIAAKLPLAGGTLTGGLSGTTGTFSGKVIMGGDGAIAQVANSVAADTSNTYTLAVGSQGSGKSILAARDINTSGGGYQINGTTVIDASRNLTNIGTISSGAITSTGVITTPSSLSLTSDSSLLQLGTGNRAQIFHNSAGLYMRTSTGPVYAQAATFTHMAADASASYLTSNSSGTTVNGNVTSTLDLISTRDISMNRSGTTPAITINNYTGFRLVTNIANGSQTSSVGVNTAGVFYTNTGFAVNTTTVIDSSRNLTNVGTISSGAITSTGGITATSITSNHTLATTEFGNNILKSNKPNEQGAFIRMAISTAANPTYAFEDDNDTGMYRSSSNALAFTAGGVGRLFITSSGNVTTSGDLSVTGALTAATLVTGVPNSSYTTYGVMADYGNATGTVPNFFALKMLGNIGGSIGLFTTDSSNSSLVFNTRGGGSLSRGMTLDQAGNLLIANELKYLGANFSHNVVDVTPATVTSNTWSTSPGNNGGYDVSNNNAGSGNYYGTVSASGVFNKHAFKWTLKGSFAAETWYPVVTRGQLQQWLGNPYGSGEDEGVSMYFRIYTYDVGGGGGDYLTSRMSERIWLNAYASNSGSSEQIAIGAGWGHAPNSGGTGDHSTYSNNPIQLRVKSNPSGDAYYPASQNIEILFKSARTLTGTGSNTVIVYGYIG